MDDPAPLSDEELEQHADQLVFDGWDAFMKPDAPSFEAPQVSATRVQIGYFSKAARNTSNIELPVLHGRAIGQPAFVRARPEWQEQVLGVPFDFYDRHGKWAPIASIDFKTPDNKPSEILLATACDRADTAWANACDDWNVNLCIYLCRCRVYNKCLHSALASLAVHLIQPIVRRSSVAFNSKQRKPLPRAKMQQLDTTDDSPVIHCFKDLDPYGEEFVEVIQDEFVNWGKTLMDDPAPLTGDELEKQADHLVFANWDTDIPPPIPSFRAPELIETRVQVGVVDKDLPDAVEGRKLWKNGLTHEIPYMRAVSPVPHARKADQPVFVRARTELLEQSLVVPFEFVDRNGNWVPRSHIDFNNRDDCETPSDILLAVACKRAETAWAKTCDDWNAELCIYRCRAVLYSMTHLEARRLGSGPRVFDLSEYRRFPKICSSIPNVLDRIRRIALVTGGQEIYNGRGRAIFKPRAAEESTAGKPENQQ
ncbi:hypothetical protein BJ166DRAFT_577266 [Pestalotiopsis sp. NC0098]|nr:hypothetical protein BJ166DRAFT_577266 [Pestalotiopsis sp. NC0098]